MKLSTFYTQVPAYLEYGWVCAPNAAGQAVAANTITTLTMDTEVVDAGGHGSIAANAVTLAAGTYAFEALTSCRQAGGVPSSATIALYNVTDGSYVTRGRLLSRDGASSFLYGFSGSVSGQFTISGSKSFDVRLLGTTGMTVDNGCYGTALSTLSTAGADQRTTLKLWKLQ